MTHFKSFLVALALFPAMSFATTVIDQSDENGQFVCKVLQQRSMDRKVSDDELQDNYAEGINHPSAEQLDAKQNGAEIDKAGIIYNRLCVKNSAAPASSSDYNENNTILKDKQTLTRDLIIEKKMPQ